MNISAKINNKDVTKIINKYKKYQLENPTSYVIFFAKIKDITISIFKSPKKVLYSLTITGKEKKDVTAILKELNINDYESEKEKVTVKKKTESKEFLFLEDQIGSDEVGTGDFFGPVTVVAALVKKKDLSRLKELGVMDSKKMTDEKIRQIGKILIKEFSYSSMCLDNVKYNEIVSKGFNMVKIKAYLHNQALYNLLKKNPKIKNVYVDQFVSSNIYYKYLKDEKNVVKNIYFHEKGESYFPSVALASVIARYSFLMNIDILNKKYNCKIPLGSSLIVEKFALNFIKKYGKEEFDKIVKKHFKTYERVLNKYNPKLI